MYPSTIPKPDISGIRFLLENKKAPYKDKYYNEL
jgi:hypothetical protein